jgi:hypothetical protein
MKLILTITVILASLPSLAMAKDRYSAGYATKLPSFSMPRGHNGGGHSTKMPSFSMPGEHNGGGYTTGRGTGVSPYHATNPNYTQRDNFSTKGNYNPYTGKFGKRTPKD